MSQLPSSRPSASRSARSGTREPRTQVVDRVARILTALAQYGPTGGRLVDVARQTGIARPSAYRLLQELAAAGFVRQVENHRYTLGSALFFLGLRTPNPIRSLPGIRAAAQDLAASCGDTVYVSMRHMDGVHYVVRTSGRFPIRAYAADVGDTVPYLNTYSGIVLLAGMGAPAESRALARWEVDRNEAWGEIDPVRHMAQLTQALAQARTRGYVYGTDFFVPGIAGLAVPVPPRNGAPLLAVSISTVTARLQPERMAVLRPQLETTARRIAGYTD